MVQYCANCKSYMLHAAGETCSAYCRDQLEVRRAETIRAQPRTTLEQLERAEVWMNDAEWDQALADANAFRLAPEDPPIDARAWRWAAMIFAIGAWLVLLGLAIVMWGPK
jgi:hypothetical protein